MHAVMYLLLVYTFIILTYELYIYDHDVKGVISPAASLLIKSSVHSWLNVWIKWRVVTIRLNLSR